MALNPKMQPPDNPEKKRLIEDDAERDLGFDVLKKSLSDEGILAKTKDQLAALSPLSDLLEIKARHAQIQESLWLSSSKGWTFPSPGSPLTALCQKLASHQFAAGIWTLTQLGELYRFFKLVLKLRDSILGQSQTHSQPGSHACYAWHAGRVDSLVSVLPLHQTLSKCLDESGDIRPDATPELQLIHRNLDKCESELQQLLSEMLQRHSVRDALAQPSWTMRDHRHVLPVRSDRRSHVPGRVRGVSATGHTLFIEPENIGLKTSEKEALLEKKAIEEARIVYETSQIVQNSCDIVLDAFISVIHIDFIHAISSFSKQIKANQPEIIEQKTAHSQVAIQVTDMRHPLLILMGRSCVPNSVTFKKHDRPVGCLVISGPNAGGKTFFMRTFGLLSLMTKCGLFVPAEGFKIPFFDKIFIEIGDHQSIQNDLSTFSAHLLKIKNICAQATPNSLIMIDEGFSGTDPALGVALAQATLEHLRSMGATVILTTHFTQLKILAGEKEDYMNGSMSFKDLKPTYEFQSNEPGSSFAFELAQRLGLSSSIILRAKELLDDRERDLENTLMELNDIKRKNESERTRLYQLSDALNQQRDALDYQIKEQHRIEKLRLKELEESVQKRLNEFLNFMNLSKNEFSKKWGLNQSSASDSYNKKPSAPKKIENFESLGNLSFPQQSSKNQKFTGADAKKLETDTNEIKEKIQKTAEDLRNVIKERQNHLLKTRSQPYEPDQTQETQAISLVNPMPWAHEDDTPKPLAPWKVGDAVRAPGSPTVGRVEEAVDGKGMILCSFGPLKMRLVAQTLVAAHPAKTGRSGVNTKGHVATPTYSGSSLSKPKATPKHRNILNFEIPTVLPHSGNVIDLRGMTADEALDKLDDFLAEAWEGGDDCVVVIHGHGTGKLKETVREALQRHRVPLGFRPGRSGEGGDGVTIVQAHLDSL